MTCEDISDAPQGHGGYVLVGEVEHTKSSPTGPAEHDEGGSLQDNS